eukprot:jgi/Botrbrau1/7352/Bobra.247_3s0044.1
MCDTIACMSCKGSLMAPLMLVLVTLGMFVSSSSASPDQTSPLRYGAPLGHLTVYPNEYPEVPRGDLIEELHGVMVPDPYRWLENADTPEVMKFVEEQNNLTNRIIGPLPGA